MAGKAVPPVPKFGSWDAENIGYTVFFEKVRENKGTPAPAAAAAPAPALASRGGSEYDFDPYEHYENHSRKAASRPPSSHGYGPAPQYPAQRGTGYHRRNGSNGSNPASEASSRGSKFSPPRPYQPRYGDNSYPPQQSGGSYGGGAYAAPAPNSYPAHQGGRGGGYNAGAHAAPPPNSYPTQQGGGGRAYNAGAYAVPAPNSYPAQQGDGSYNAGAYTSPSAPRHNYQHAAPRAAASPPRHAPPPVNNPAGRPIKASAVPKFGVWDDPNSTGAAHGFTVQFDKVKQHREVGKTAAPDVPPQLISPEQAAPTWQQRPQRKPRKSFMSKMCGCMFPKDCVSQHPIPFPPHGNALSSAEVKVGDHRIAEQDYQDCVWPAMES